MYNFFVLIIAQEFIHICKYWKTLIYYSVSISGNSLLPTSQLAQCRALWDEPERVRL